MSLGALFLYNLQYIEESETKFPFSIFVAYLAYLGGESSSDAVLLGPCILISSHTILLCYTDEFEQP